MINLMPKGSPRNPKLLSRFAVYLLAGLLGIIWCSSALSAEPMADLRIITEDGTLVIELAVAGEPEVTATGCGEDGAAPEFTLASVDAEELLGGNRSEIPTGYIPAPVLRVEQTAEGVNFTFPGAVAGLKGDWRSNHEVVRLAVFTGENPLPALDVMGHLGEDVEPVVHKISHRSEGGVDIFTFSFRGEVPEPSVTMATDGLWVVFDGCTVDLPTGSEGEFSTPVHGEMIGRLDVFVDEAPFSRVGLIPLAGARFSYEVIFDGGSDMIIRCYSAPAMPAGEVEIVEPTPVESAPVVEVPVEVETPQPEPAHSTGFARVVKVKYDPVGDIDRFTFNIDGPTPEVNVQVLSYPDRLKVDLMPAAVELPEDARGSFETPVPGIGVVNMLAVNTDTSEGRTAEFTFALESERSIDDVKIEVDASRPDRIVVNVYNLPVQVPYVKSPAPPVEVPAVEEIPVEAPEAEAVEPEPEPVIEEPAVVEDIAIEEKPVYIPLTPEPLGPARIDISVNLATRPNGSATIQLTGDSPFAKPVLKTLSYPTRLNLTLPYASLSFRGDDSGTWDIDENPIAKLRAVDNVDIDEGNFNSSLFVYLPGGIGLDRIKTEVRPSGDASYDIVINVKPEAAPVEMPVAPEPVPEPAVEVEEAPAVEPIAEPEEVDVPLEKPVDEEEIEIEVESYVVEPAPPFIEPSAEEIENPPTVGEDETPAIAEELEMISPLPVVLEEVEETSYPSLSVNVLPNKDGADRFVIEFDGPVTEPEVNRFNHPPRLTLVFNDVRADGGKALAYDYTDVMQGALATRYKLTQVVDDDSGAPRSILEIDATSAEGPDEIGYRVDTEGSRLVVDVYPLAAAGEVEPAFKGSPVAAATAGVIPPLAALQPAVSLTLDDIAAIESAETEEVAPADLVKKTETETHITINVKDGNIVDVLQVIMLQAQLPNIIDPSVVGRVSLSLVDTPLSVVLDLLGDQANFDFYIKSGVYNFAREDVLAKKFPEFYGTWIIELAYADPNQLRTILTSQGIVESRNVIVYQPAIASETNLYTSTKKLLIRASDNDIKLAMAIVRVMDEPPPQILYDVKIIQASANVRENLGVQWLTNTNISEEAGAMGFFLEEKPAYDPALAAEGVKGITEYFPQGLLRDRYTFTATLNYLQSEGSAKILANPTISALQGQPARYFVGQSVPYRSTFQVSDIGRVTQRVAQEQIGITLNVAGFAASNDTVTMFISPEISNLLELTEIGPRTSRNRFQTVMRVTDGETFVMAGLINEEDRISKTSVPVLGDLPLIGGLFRNKKNDVDRTELIIAITPHIIRPIDYEGPKVYRATVLQELFGGS